MVSSEMPTGFANLIKTITTVSGGTTGGPTQSAHLLSLNKRECHYILSLSAEAPNPWVLPVPPSEAGLCLFLISCLQDGPLHPDVLLLRLSALRDLATYSVITS